ncbi:hypothetical protein [uncultured Nitratireductor sp.]|uniref:hypothetical protein n=1 Tax=uncultured Nitratireductor sp. TaxID=520953 RepID=UPI0025FA8AB9|nr:hypothetical protein [uncultured Nitratireductor sp.]
MDASFHAVSSANPLIPQLPFVKANVFVGRQAKPDAPNERIDPELGFWFLLANPIVSASFDDARAGGFAKWPT